MLSHLTVHGGASVSEANSSGSASSHMIASFIGSVHDQRCPLLRFQMLENRWPADAEECGERVYRCFSRRERSQDRASGRIGERGKHRIEFRSLTLSDQTRNDVRRSSKHGQMGRNHLTLV